MLTRNLRMLASGAHIDAGLFNTHEFIQQTVLPCITHLTRRLAEPSRNPDQPIQSQVLGQVPHPFDQKTVVAGQSLEPGNESRLRNL
jgi:hypothetical protein